MHFCSRQGGFSAQADGTTADATCPQLGGGLCREQSCAPVRPPDRFWLRTCVPTLREARAVRTAVVTGRGTRLRAAQATAHLAVSELVPIVCTKPDHGAGLRERPTKAGASAEK